MFKKFDGIIVDEVICYEETVKMKLAEDEETEEKNE